jgi:hypothetical protein
MSADLREMTASPAPHAALRPGLRIDFPDDPTALAQRIWLSAGTSPADDGYVDGAFVPRGPWRPPSAAELRLLDMGAGAAAHEWRRSTDIAIVRMPDDVILPFTEILEQRGLREAADPKTYETIATHPRWPGNLAAMREYLGQLCDEQLNQIFFRIAEPNPTDLDEG